MLLCVYDTNLNHSRYCLSCRYIKGPQTFLPSLLICSSQKSSINYCKLVNIMMKPVSFPSYFSHVSKNVQHMRVPLKSVLTQAYALLLSLFFFFFFLSCSSCFVCNEVTLLNNRWNLLIGMLDEAQPPNECPSTH